VREGARVHICDVDVKALAAAKSSDPELTQTVCDVSDRGQVATLFEQALNALGGLGLPRQQCRHRRPNRQVEEINPEDWDVASPST